MIFNSIEFLAFFLVFFALYYFLLKEKTKLQNILILLASYVFYAFADWKILPLLVASTAVFYGLGIAVHNAKTEKTKSLFSALGVIVGLGILLYFKYANFFITSFSDLFESIGLATNWHTLSIIVPVGISFYTFRLLSYIIDIRNDKYEPTRDVVVFSAYVAFFPSILSGPIDRPNLLIPQLQNKRAFNYDLAVDGCRQILLGLFKKLVIANNCAIYVNAVYGNFQAQNSSTLLLAAVLFSFQLYADFAGYSDMAIGVGKILGFRITNNFNYPFFAQNIAEYWRRWHISLTSWLTDYVFMPLNVKWRDGGNWGMIGAIMITFVLVGFWHGANWTFIFFGFIQGLLYIPLIFSGKMFKKPKLSTGKFGFPRIKVFLNMLLTFTIVTFGNIIFKSETIGESFNYMRRIFSLSLFSKPDKIEALNLFAMAMLLFFIVAMIVVEWVQRNKSHALDITDINNKWLRRAIYFIIIFCIVWFTGKNETFIYFQF